MDKLQKFMSFSPLPEYRIKLMQDGRRKAREARAKQSPNKLNDAIIDEAVAAWLEWDATPDGFFTERLVEAMHALAEKYKK